MQRKGIILAGGMGTRLYPATMGVSKQMMPVYDKPMIYYPLSTLMIAGIKDILIISTERDLPLFKDLLGDGSRWGISLSYKVQDKPNGIAESLIIAEEFLGGSPCALILGDNIFYGSDMQQILHKAHSNISGATIFTYSVADPRRYGIACFNEEEVVVSLEEKPSYPKSDQAVTGLYFYDSRAPEYVKSLKPSKRGELEITDLNSVYLEKGELFVQKFSRGHAWLDMGTHDSLMESSQFISAIERRQGIKIACLEEVSWNQGWISDEEVKKASILMGSTEYGRYLGRLVKEK
ncbi:MAG: hypothetical protein DGJ47_001056 [Rickettsiaceae bacterium]